MSITDPLVGNQLGDYCIEDLLGRGGMARVYRGYDEKLDRYAAVKIIDASLSMEPEDIYRQRFQREARAIARLNHPNIVGVYQFGESDSIYYMAMAFIEGRDLAQVLWAYEREGRLMPYRDILRLIRGLASALDHAHSGGVIHRDIKPSNIMVTLDGHAVLTDFGLALSVPEGSMGNTFGSAHYIAPEQAVSSAAAVPQSDFYSLGVVLYLMLTGRVPFEDPSAMAVVLKHLNEPPPPPRTLNARIPLEVEAVVLRMLEKDPAQRYRSGQEMFDALEEAFAAAGDNTESRRPSELEYAIAAPVSAALTERTRTTHQSKPVLAQHQRGSRRGRLAMLVTLSVLALLAIGAGAVLLPESLSPTETTEPIVTMVPGASGAGTHTPPVTVLASASQTPAVVAQAEIVVMLPTSMAPGETTAPTVTHPPVSTATDMPSPTMLPASTIPSTAASSAATEAISVELHFDNATLVLYNRSDRAIDVSNLQFVQTTPTGTLNFRSSFWTDDGMLQPKACFQVWTNRYLELSAPDYCEVRQSWRAVSFVRWFWMSEDPHAGFEVRRGDRVLARCAIQDGTCTVSFTS